MSQEFKRPENDYSANSEHLIMPDDQPSFTTKYVPTFNVKFVCSNCRRQVPALGYDSAQTVMYTGRFLLQQMLSNMDCPACGIHDYPTMVINQPLFEATQLIEQYKQDAASMGITLEEYVKPVFEPGFE